VIADAGPSGEKALTTKINAERLTEIRTQLPSLANRRLSS